MRRLWQGLASIVFWSYERGSWPYDVMVLTIIAFVLLTPRSWFHDQPQLADAGSAGVLLMSQDSDGKTRTYRLDAAMLSPEKRTTRSTPELERETHDIIERRVQEFKDQRFRVVQIDPTLSGDGSVLYYSVTIVL
ncbi:MAG: hypothetical protein ABSA57_08760 [Candidatus Acidiferrales bacterium]|jgi:hypothetical protein